MSENKHTPEPVALTHAAWLEKSLTIGAREAASELRRLHEVEKQRDELLAALEFYAERNHFILHDANAWETVSGEPQNFQEDEANTATVEDGSVAKAAVSRVKGEQ